MYTMFASGVALWLVYGLVINSMPLIVTNALTLAFALSILAMKIREVQK
jgi:MtN3 and saliva related transmembrane protein